METFSPAIKLVDKYFDRDFSSGSHLSVILGLNGFAYCVFDIKQNRLSVLEEILFLKQPNFSELCKQFRTYFSQSPVLGAHYKSVSVGVYHEISTLVPSALFDAGKQKEILQFNFSAEIFSALNDFLQETDIYNVFDAPPVISETIGELFGKTKIVHFSSSLIESIAIENKHRPGLNVYLHFFQKNSYGTHSRFELIVFKNGKLVFYNSFHFQEKEDIAYYLLFVLEQMGINPENVTLTILGNMQKTDEAVVLLENYIKGVEFGKRPGNFEYSSVFDELPPHFYYALLSQYLYA